MKFYCLLAGYLEKGREHSPSDSHEVIQETPAPAKHPNRVKNTKEFLKHALHRIFDHCDWAEYQQNRFWQFPFLSCRGRKTAQAGCAPAPLGAPPSPSKDPNRVKKHMKRV